MQSSFKYTNVYEKIQNLFKKIESIPKCERTESKITLENLKSNHKIATLILPKITHHSIVQ